MTLRLSSPDWHGHTPGQHVDVRLTAEDGYQAQRSYSIGSAPAEGWLDLTVEDITEGEVSPYLAEFLQPGDMLELRGPIGGYFNWTPDDGGPLLLIAGGSGVVPLMSMLRLRREVGSTVPTTLLMSSRDATDIIYRDELESLAADPTLRVVHTLTRGHPPDWTGYTRRIDAAMLAEVAGTPEPSGLAYVCGPTGLVEIVAGDLVTLGYTPDRVLTERFGPTSSSTLNRRVVSRLSRDLVSVGNTTGSLDKLETQFREPGAQLHPKARSTLRGRVEVFLGPFARGLGFRRGTGSFFLGQADALVDGGDIPRHQGAHLLVSFRQPDCHVTRGHAQRTPVLRAAPHHQQLEGGAVRIDGALAVHAPGRVPALQDARNRPRIAVDLVAVHVKESGFLCHRHYPPQRCTLASFCLPAPCRAGISPGQV
jgi:ferredoxin-NADP reductase